MNFFSPTLGLINITSNHNTNIYYKSVISNSEKEGEAKKVVLKFAYESLKEPIKKNKKIKKRFLLNLFNEWFCLPVSEDFDVDVYNVKTGERSAEKAKAIKLFLTDAKDETYLKGFIRNYVNYSEGIRQFTSKNKLYKDEEQLYKFRRLYYYFLVISKIIMGKTINNDGVISAKVCYNKYDFHFGVDIEEDKLKEQCSILNKDYNDFIKYPFNYGAVEMGKEILCENIVPELFSNLGYIDDEIIKKDSQIFNLNCYSIYFND